MTSAPRESLIVALRDACVRHYGGRLVAIAVFGSTGRGTARPDSDIDLLVVADGLPDGRVPRVADFGAVEAIIARRWTRRGDPDWRRGSRPS